MLRSRDGLTLTFKRYRDDNQTLVHTMAQILPNVADTEYTIVGSGEDGFSEKVGSYLSTLMPLWGKESPNSSAAAASFMKTSVFMAKKSSVLDQPASTRLKTPSE